MKNLEKLLDTLNYRFDNQNLLITALTHRSYANEHSISNNIKDNERLEFLGDAVLDLITSEYVIKKFPNLKEGQLSKLKSQIISETSFSQVARQINLGDFLLLSNGENSTGGRTRSSLLCDAFEALIGAIYLDSDYYTTRDIALKLLKNNISNLDKLDGIVDYKTELQEFIQSKHKITPTYTVLSESGPDHDKEFKIAVSIYDEIIGVGIAKSKKLAEKSAAKNAIDKLKENIYDK